MLMSMPLYQKVIMKTYMCILLCFLCLYTFADKKAVYPFKCDRYIMPSIQSNTLENESHHITNT